MGTSLNAPPPLTRAPSGELQRPQGPGAPAGQAVYISNCKSSAIHVHGKATNITVDGCSKLALTFSGVLAKAEVANSDKISCW